MKDMSILFEEWDDLKEEISLLFREKNKMQATLRLEKGIELFIKSLFWTNDSEIKPLSNENLGKLQFKPVNVEERISFVMSQPKLHHSLAVLTELMKEQKKLFHKRVVTKKASKPE